MAAGLGTEITLVTITIHLQDHSVLVIIMNSGTGLSKLRSAHELLCILGTGNGRSTIDWDNVSQIGPLVVIDEGYTYSS